MGLMRVQFANAEVRHEGAAILTSLYPELAYITGGTLVNTGTAAGLAQPNYGTSRQLLVSPATCLHLSEQ